MSCWRRTTVLRIPASALRLEYRWQWNEFLKKHEGEFDSEPGFFDESLCDDYPLFFRREPADRYDPDMRLDAADPAHPEIIPGPFLDYYLEEIIPLPPEDNSYHDNDIARPLEVSETEKYLPVFRKLIPGFTPEEMKAVRWCRYEWYDGTNAPYIY